MIPACTGPYATLPPGRHPATLQEVYDRFVVAAPFRARRELIFRAVSLYVDLVKLDFPTARFWLDGGFVTHKTWAPPEDADIVVVVDMTEIGRTQEDRFLPLHSMLDAAADQPRCSTAKLHPMGGLIDAFIIPDFAPALDAWDRNWSYVKDQSGTLVSGVSKGYLEVGP